MSNPDVSLIPKSPAEVAKAITYIALSAIGILITALGDNVLSLVELVQTAIVIAGAVPVYLLTGTLVKTASGFGIAGAQALLLVLADGTGLANVSLVNWLVVLVTAFAAIGIAVVPNKPMIDAGTARAGVPVTVTNITR